MRINGRSVGMCALYVAVGAIVGGLVGVLLRSIDAFAGLAPYLASQTQIFSIAPFTLDLFVFQITLGFAFTPNLMAGLGMVLGFLAFRKF